MYKIVFHSSASIFSFQSFMQITKKASFLKVVHCYKKHIGLAKDINFLHLINKNKICSRNLYRNSNPFMYVGWYDG